jgi:hypothetical protein
MWQSRAHYEIVMHIFQRRGLSDRNSRSRQPKTPSTVTYSSLVACALPAFLLPLHCTSTRTYLPTTIAAKQNFIHTEMIHSSSLI